MLPDNRILLVIGSASGQLTDLSPHGMLSWQAALSKSAGFSSLSVKRAANLRELLVCWLKISPWPFQLMGF